MMRPHGHAMEKKIEAVLTFFGQVRVFFAIFGGRLLWTSLNIKFLKTF